MLACCLFDLCCLLGLHHARGSFANQSFKVYSIDEVDWIEHITLGFGHFLSFSISHQAMDIHLLERHFVFQVKRHHDHARDPEKDDVEACDQYRSRVESC